MRIGLHTGTPLLSGDGYVGADVHRAARIAAVAHGGQVVVSAATVALTGTEGLHDLGAHRLKDLSAPERLYQLGHEDFPPLRSLYSTNLPVPSTPFLGRERELSEVSALLYDGARLLTLTGAGGSGKTRLALQSAGAVSDAFPDGVYWVPLAPLRDPRLVLDAAAKSLDAEDVAGRITDKRVLLYFDNFEHLLDASADIAELVGACPNMKVLVTSREPLHLSGEQEYAVPPFVHQEGVGFFLARARAIDPAFEAHPAVAEICTRLDNLPLALELAAARVKALPPEQLLQRLEQRLPLLTGGARDLPERQRTLAATIAWSYDLLRPRSSARSARWGSSSVAARSPRPTRSPMRTSTCCSRCSTRASCGEPRSATGCSRRFASSHSNSFERRATTTSSLAGTSTVTRGWRTRRTSRPTPTVARSPSS